MARGFNIYGEPRPWGSGSAPAYIEFLNTSKYPASFLFLLMTLGPTILLIPFVENACGAMARMLVIFGRVPFFYYVLHIPLIHLVFVLLSLVRYGEVVPWLMVNHPLFVPPAPEGYMYSLAALYSITILVVAILYVPCRWFASLKQRRKDRWLSHL